MYDLTLYLFIIWQASAATELRRRTQREETGVNEYTESEAGEDLRDTSSESQRLPRPAHDGLDVSVENETEALDSHAMSRHLLAGTPASTPAPITTGSIGHWTSGGTCYEHNIYIYIYVCMYVCIVCMYVCICVYIYMYI